MCVCVCTCMRVCAGADPGWGPGGPEPHIFFISIIKKK